MAEVIKEFSEKTFLYVTSEDGSSKGWRIDLLVEKLSSKMEEKLLLCRCCNGMLRDACICNGALMCQVCIPEGTAWQPVLMNREIVNEKIIYCSMKFRGCGWSDTISAAVHHLEACLYLPEVCPLGCVSLEGEKKGEVVRMERRYIPEHVKYSCPLREIVCEFCKGKVKASEMNSHFEDCEEFPIHCPNGCSGEGEDGVRKVRRKDICDHLDNHCPLQIVQCPFWDHGCRVGMKRKYTDTHEREFLHSHFKLSMKSSRAELNAATERIAILEKQNSDKDLQMVSLITYLVPQLPKGRLEWKVEGVKQKIRNKESSCSDPFYVGLYKCQSNIYWDFGSTGNVLVDIRIMKGDFDAKLHWPIRYRYTIVLINQNNSKDNLVYSVEITKEDLEIYPEYFKRPTGIRNDSFEITSLISNTNILEDKYCKRDSITLHISVEVLPPL